MKRTVIALALAVAGSIAVTASSQAQGLILLDNYQNSGPLIGYNGSPITDTEGFTVGLYWEVGTPTVPVDPSGTGDPSIFSSLALATGLGSTAPIDSVPGYFTSTEYFEPAGVAGGGVTITVELSVYNGSTYADSTERGHSSAFTAVTGASGSGGNIGVYWLASGAPAGVIAFSALPTTPTPEPATFAMLGLGFASLLAFRRRNNK